MEAEKEGGGGCFGANMRPCLAGTTTIGAARRGRVRIRVCRLLADPRAREVGQKDRELGGNNDVLERGVRSRDQAHKLPTVYRFISTYLGKRQSWRKQRKYAILRSGEGR